MKTIAIPQFYCGPSGQKGLYNRQEVGLARAFAALGCRAVVLYPAPGAAAPTVEKPEPNVKIYYLPVRKLGAQAFFSSWQVLLDEQVDAVHVMGDNSPGVPSLYRFCRKHGILFYSQLGALKSTSGRAAVRAVMDLLLRRNLAVYKKTPTFAKTPAVAAELQSLGVPCTGLMPVGLDTAIIPDVPGTRADLRRALKLDVDAKIFVFVGRLDAYKKPLDLVPLLEAAPDWQAVIIGQGTQGAELARLLAARGLAARCRMIPQLPNESVHVYYHACDAFVNLNDQEIFGMSLLEAMLPASGSPRAWAGPHHRGRPQWLAVQHGAPAGRGSGPHHARDGRCRTTTYQRAFSVAEQCRAGADPAARQRKPPWITTTNWCKKPPTFTAACASA